MKWKVIKEIKAGSKIIPKGSILTQVKNLDIQLSVNKTMQSLYKMDAYLNLVVCNVDYNQFIFVVGKEVIPYGRGVI